MASHRVHEEDSGTEHRSADAKHQDSAAMTDSAVPRPLAAAVPPSTQSPADVTSLAPSDSATASAGQQSTPVSRSAADTLSLLSQEPSERPGAEERALSAAALPNPTAPAGMPAFPLGVPVPVPLRTPITSLPRPHKPGLVLRDEYGRLLKASRDYRCFRGWNLVQVRDFITAQAASEENAGYYTTLSTKRSIHTPEVVHKNQQYPFLRMICRFGANRRSDPSPPTAQTLRAAANAAATAAAATAADMHPSRLLASSHAPGASDQDVVADGQKNKRRRLLEQARPDSSDGADASVDEPTDRRSFDAMAQQQRAVQLTQEEQMKRLHHLDSRAGITDSVEEETVGFPAAQPARKPELCHMKVNLSWKPDAGRSGPVKGRVAVETATFNEDSWKHGAWMVRDLVVTHSGHPLTRETTSHASGYPLVLPPRVSTAAAAQSSLSASSLAAAATGKVGIAPVQQQQQHVE